MVLSFKTGQWNSRTTTGTDVITGTGFTPKVILLYSAAYDTSYDTLGGYTQFSLGAAINTTAANQKAIWLDSVDGAATSSTDSWWHAAAITIPGSASSIGVISAIGSDGFTVNWTSASGTVNHMYYLCIGGTDITNTFCSQFTSPTSGTTGNQIITGVGFQPDLVILFSCGATTDTASKTGLVYGIGFATSSSNQVCLSGTSKNAQATMSCKSYQRGDNTVCFALIDETTVTNKGLEGSLVSMNADGFTINWTTVSASGGSKKIGFIAIKGGSYKCGAITAPTTGTTPVSQSTTGVGFQPSGLLTASVGAVSSTAIGANNIIELGAGSSSTDRRCIFTGDNDAAANAVTTNINKSANIFTNYNIVATESSSTIKAEADLTTLNADGFTLSWTTRDTNAYEMLYLAMGNTIAVTGARNLQISKGWFYSDN